MTFVIDASAAIAFVRGEEGGAVVLAALLDSRHTCYIHAVNLCEVYYDFHRAGGEAAADRVVSDLEASGVTRNARMSRSFCRAASALKSEFKRVSLADCFALALATELGGRLLTSDHHELDPIAATGRFSLTFIR